jgi:ATP-dependent Lon protease
MVKASIRDRLRLDLRREERGLSSGGGAILLHSAPGVGKTSLARAIAKGLDRPLVGIPLFGLCDGWELAGERQGWSSAKPGLIAEAMVRAGCRNPVILLDEIDKIASKGVHSSPETVLLAALDPSQNRHFKDAFEDHPRDLGGVLWIGTANSLDAISRPLLSRMEVYELPGYDVVERIGIARCHLLPQSLNEAAFTPEEVEVDEAVIEAMAVSCVEPGVRELKQRIDLLVRYANRKSDEGLNPVRIRASDLDDIFIGRVLKLENELPGPAVGSALAVTVASGIYSVAEVLACARHSSGLVLTPSSLPPSALDDVLIAISALSATLSRGLQVSPTTSYHVHLSSRRPIIGEPICLSAAVATAIASSLMQAPARPACVLATLDISGRLKPVPRAEEIAAQLIRNNVREFYVPAPLRIEGAAFHIFHDLNSLIGSILSATQEHSSCGSSSVDGYVSHHAGYL